MNDTGHQFRMMTVAATSPDGNVRASITGERILRIDFRAHSFGLYDEVGLGHQLAGLAVKAWVAWERERREINRVASGMTRAEFEVARQDRENQEPAAFREKLRAMECTGISSGHTVVIQTIGMINWQITIANGTLGRLDARQFASRAVAAFESLLQDREFKLIRLKAEHFDIGVPRSWRLRAS